MTAGCTTSARSATACGGSGLIWPTSSPATSGRSGFANVAAGRVDGTEVELEWADLTVGNLVGGGGLTVTVDEGGDKLTVTGQRGDWGFGGKTLNRVANASASPTP